MSLLITTNDLKYKGIVLDTTSVLITVEPLLSTKKTITTVNAENIEETYFQVRTNVYVTHDENSHQKLEIDGIYAAYHCNFTNANDLNIQYVQVHQNLISQIESQNPHWVGKITEHYIS